MLVVSENCKMQQRRIYQRVQGGAEFSATYKLIEGAIAKRNHSSTELSAFKFNKFGIKSANHDFCGDAIIRHFNRNWINRI